MDTKFVESLLIQ